MKNRGIQLSDGISDTIDLKINVVRDAAGLITQGLIVGNILNQNQALIIIANPGEFKFNPTIGVAIDEMLLNEDYLQYRHRIRDHLTKDGMKVKSVDFSKKMGLVIDASYD